MLLCCYYVAIMKLLLFAGLAGHCHKLADYRSVVSPNASPLCHHCDHETEILAAGMSGIGHKTYPRIWRSGISVSSSGNQPMTVIAYAHGLWSM